MFSPFTKGAARALHLNGMKSRRVAKSRRGMKQLANRRNRRLRGRFVKVLLHGEESVVEGVDRFTERDTN